MKKILLLIVIVIVEGSPAQTRVCSGDTVMLVLSGYKQGSTLWLESSDLITWYKATGTSYNDSLVITATTTLYYRAKVTDGSCAKINSDTVLITVHPAPPPIAKPASDITPIFFDANWAAVAGATTYYIDVATDNGFTSFVSGYNNLTVKNKTIYTVSGLLPGTTYYYRVRVYDDSCGRIRGNSNTIILTTAGYPIECRVKSTCSGNFTDTRDSKTYKTVQIGTQCWMAQNLDVGNRIDGNKPQTPGTENQNADIQKYCYSNLPANCNTYGGLYLWNEMMAYDTSRANAPGPRGICPTAWHLPTDSEWTCLEKTVGTSTTAGGKLKDTTFWNSPNKGATNSSGFTALPGGFRPDPTTFSLVASYGIWWTATESDAAYAWYHFFDNTTAQAGQVVDAKAFIGASVRCVKDF